MGVIAILPEIIGRCNCLARGRGRVRRRISITGLYNRRRRSRGGRVGWIRGRRRPRVTTVGTDLDHLEDNARVLFNPKRCATMNAKRLNIAILRNIPNRGGGESKIPTDILFPNGEINYSYFFFLHVPFLLSV